MTEREKIQKAFNHCSDALMSLEQKSILKVFHLLSVHFDITPAVINKQNETDQRNVTPQVTYLPAGNNDDNFEESEDETKKVNRKGTGSKRGKGSALNLIFLTDFDFRPSNAESLKEFHAKYKAKTNMEFNLIFTYYLQMILNIEEITMNHIYSCYRHMGLKIPSFPQTLIDTKGVKGWIETSNTNDLKITREGINYIEHDMPKNDGE